MRTIVRLLLILPFALHVDAAEFHVSPTGKDAWSGRLPEPNQAGTDGPVRTLAGARDAIRKQRANVRQQVVEAFSVQIHGGAYALDRTFELTADDSGSPGAPVTWQAYKNEPVRLVGGREITRWFRVDDAAIRRRIQPEWRDKIRQADLTLHGVTNYGKMRPSGFGRPIAPAPMELFFAGRPMTLARWPNEGWATISTVPAGQQGDRFTCQAAPMERWLTADDLWMHGFWTYDWADSFAQVASLNLPKKEITTAPPHGAYGYTVGKRFYAVNLIEELDEPGEYWIDRKGEKIYFWAPDSLEQNETWVSVLEDPMIRLSGVRYVTVVGLTLEYTRGKAIEMIGGSHNLIDRCTLRNIGTFAVGIANDPAATTATTESGVSDCDIYDCGDGGVQLGGGDRKTLTPGGNYVTNSRIHRYQRRCLTYRPAVLLDGVGQHVAHNLIFDAPHTGVLLHGNDHVIEYNEFHHLCGETGDAGAFYLGRDLTERGNIVRYNYFHDLAGVKGQTGFTDVMGVYMDDCACGTTVFGNIFQNVARAIVLGGGRDNTIENNIFLDCPIAVHVDARATTWAKFWWDGKDHTLTDRLKAMSHDRPPYIERYPKLAHILEDEPALPKGNRIAHNICAGPGKWLALSDVKEILLGIEDNFVGPDAGFVDATRRDFHLRAGAPAASIKFQPISLELIGPRTRSSLTPSREAGKPRLDPGAPPD